MSIPAGTVRVQLSGTLGASEVWATSFYLDGYAETDIDSASATALITASPAATFLTSLQALMSGGDAITACDMYYYAGGPSATRHSHAALTGLSGSGSVPHPKQIACVMTLRTADTTRSGRGRMYLPATGVAVATSGLVSSSGVTAALTNLGSWFSALTDSDTHVVVVSKTQSVVRPVVSIDADGVLDTIRARRAHITGPRTSVAVS